MQSVVTVAYIHRCTGWASTSEPLDTDWTGDREVEVDDLRGRGKGADRYTHAIFQQLFRTSIT